MNSVGYFQSRKPFDYRLRLVCGDYFKADQFCCLKCCICCRKSRTGQRFDKAKVAMYQELDIVCLLKQIRFFSFITSLDVKQHHYALLHWFDEFRISDS